MLFDTAQSDCAKYFKVVSVKGLTVASMPGNDAYTIKWQSSQMPQLSRPTSIGWGVDGIIYVGYSDRVIALNSRDGSLAWEYNPDDDWLGPIGIDFTKQGLVVGSKSKDDGRLISINGDGARRWEKGVGIGQIMGAPVVSDDEVIYVNDGRSLLKLDMQGERIWTNDDVMGAGCALSPDATVVYTVLTDVTAVDTANGRVLWSFKQEAFGTRYTTPVLGLAGTLYVGRATFLDDPPHGSVPGGIVALTNKGKTLWSSDASQVGPVVYPPALSVDMTLLFVGTNDGNLFILDARNGNIKAKWSIGGKALMPVTYGDTVFVATETPTYTSIVYALNIQNGYHRWSHEFRNGFNSHVMMVGLDGTLYMSGDYSVIAFTDHGRAAVQVGSISGGSNDGGGGGIAGLVVIAILAVAVVFAVRHGSKR